MSFLVTILTAPSLAVESHQARRDMTPFVLRTFIHKGDALKACNKGYEYYSGPRSGFISHPTAKRTGWQVVREYEVDRDPAYLTHQSCGFLRDRFGIPGFVQPIKRDIQAEDRALFPNIPFDHDYQPPTNGLNSVWCSKSDPRYDYLEHASIIDPADWAKQGGSLGGRIGLVLEAYFKSKGIGFKCVFPQAMP